MAARITEFETNVPVTLKSIPGKYRSWLLRKELSEDAILALNKQKGPSRSREKWDRVLAVMAARITEIETNVPVTLKSIPGKYRSWLSCKELSKDAIQALNKQKGPSRSREKWDRVLAVMAARITEIETNIPVTLKSIPGKYRSWLSCKELSKDAIQAFNKRKGPSRSTEKWDRVSGAMAARITEFETNVPVALSIQSQQSSAVDCRVNNCLTMQS